MKELLKKLNHGIDENDAELYERIMQYENPHREGFDEATQTWLPHQSVEGGHDTIAFGSKLLPGKFSQQQLDKFYKMGISDAEAKQLLKHEVEKAKFGANKIISERKLQYLNPKQRQAITEMVYQMGVQGVQKFPKMLDALEQKNVRGAFEEALNSKWAREDSPQRALEVSERLLDSKQQYTPIQKQLNEFKQLRNLSSEDLNLINKLPEGPIKDSTTSTFNQTDEAGKEKVRKMIDITRLA